METFNEVFQFIWDNDYLRFLLIVVISFIAAFVIKMITRKILKPLAKKTKTKIDDLVVKSISSIIFYFSLFFGVKIGLQHFEFEEPTLENVINSLLIIVIVLFFLRIIGGVGYDKPPGMDFASTMKGVGWGLWLALVSSLTAYVTCIKASNYVK